MSTERIRSTCSTTAAITAGQACRPREPCRDRAGFLVDAHCHWVPVAVNAVASSYAFVASRPLGIVGT
jgi:hypothetical protein